MYTLHTSAIEILRLFQFLDCHLIHALEVRSFDATIKPTSTDSQSNFMFGQNRNNAQFHLVDVAMVVFMCKIVVSTFDGIHTIHTYTHTHKAKLVSKSGVLTIDEGSK